MTHQGKAGLVHRAVLFVDGNNWYHSLKEAGVLRLGDLDYGRISRKLLMAGREWKALRYYIGRMTNAIDPRRYDEQQRFCARLRATDPRISVHFGRLELRPRTSDAAVELLAYLGDLSVRIDARIFKDLLSIAMRHKRTLVPTEKAVDVMLAVDAVTMAQRGEYDVAYLLTADGDFTPVATAVRSCGRKIFAATCGPAAQLAAAVDTFIPLKSGWFRDCYVDAGIP